MKQIFRVTARGEGGHGAVVHTVVQRNEGSSPAGDRRGARGGTGRGDRGGDQAERRRADYSTDSVHGADTRIGEHLQVQTNATYVIALLQQMLTVYFSDHTSRVELITKI